METIIYRRVRSANKKGVWSLEALSTVLVPFRFKELGDGATSDLHRTSP